MILLYPCVPVITFKGFTGTFVLLPVQDSMKEYNSQVES